MFIGQPVMNIHSVNEYANWLTSGHAREYSTYICKPCILFSVSLNIFVSHSRNEEKRLYE